MATVDVFAGMYLDCTRCRPGVRPDAVHKPDDPESVCRCRRCGKKHSTDSLVVR